MELKIEIKKKERGKIFEGNDTDVKGMNKVKKAEIIRKKGLMPCF